MLDLSDVMRCGSTLDESVGAGYQRIFVPVLTMAITLHRDFTLQESLPRAL